jgi:hypothetical protein
MSDEDGQEECQNVDTLSTDVKAGGLRRIRHLVAKGQYRLSVKAYHLQAEGHFELEDFENSIRCGKVQKTEKDEMKDCIGNKKYVIVGPDSHGYEFYSVGKIKLCSDGHVYYVITAHPEGANYV